MPDWKEELQRRLTSLALAPAREAEIIEELSQHMEDRYREFLYNGATADEAYNAVLAELNEKDLLSQELSRIEPRVPPDPTVLGSKKTNNLIADVWQDVRFAARLLLKAPRFSLLAILTLGLGIGASTAIFSAVNPVLFEPLPYANSEELMRLWDQGPDGSRQDVTFGTYRELVERNRSFEQIAVMRTWQPTLTGPAEPERLDGQRVSASFFQLLGVWPELGQSFQSSDDRIQGPKVAILSNALWQRRFSGDPEVIGRQITLDDTSYLIIGVLPAAFENVVAPSAEIWTLLQYDASLPSFDGREWGHHLRMLARLKDGISKETAKREIDLIARTPIAQYARPPWASFKNGLIINSLQEDLTRSVRPALLTVFGAVMLVLAIACVNVTNLFLARGAQRRGEFAVRVALGAARLRMMRQLLMESLWLAICGGAVSILVAKTGVRALVALSPPELPRIEAMKFDGSVFLFCAGVTTMAGVLVGLIAALQASRGTAQIGLQQNSNRTVGGHHRTRRALVIAQVALALVLLLSAGLLLRSLRHLLAVPPGFDSANLLTMQVQTSARRFDAGSTHRFFAQSLDMIRRVPGVTQAAFTSQLPLSGDTDEYGVHFAPDTGEQMRGGYSSFRYAVTPEYFKVMRIPLRRGRLLDSRDRMGSPLAVVISESLAKRIFLSQNPIGKRLYIGASKGEPWTIVGVVGDVRQISLSVSGMDAVYTSTTQWPFTDNTLSLVVRTQGDAATFTTEIKRAIWSVDKDQPIVRIASMSSLVRASAAERRFAMILFEIFGIVSLVLAVTGLYGVLSGRINERTREIGLRLALGANRSDILRMVLRQGLVLTATGIALGLAAASVATRVLQSLLFGISSTDAATFVAVPILLAFFALLACWFPARRATKVDPLIALRYE